MRLFICVASIILQLTFRYVLMHRQSSWTQKNIETCSQPEVWRNKSWGKWEQKWGVHETEWDIDMLDMLGQPQQLLSFQILIARAVTWWHLWHLWDLWQLWLLWLARCGSNHDGRPFCPDPTAVRGAPWGPAVPGAMSLAAKLHGEARSAEEPRTVKCDIWWLNETQCCDHVVTCYDTLTRWDGSHYSIIAFKIWSLLDLQGNAGEGRKRRYAHTAATSSFGELGISEISPVCVCRPSVPPSVWPTTTTSSTSNIIIILSVSLGTPLEFCFIFLRLHFCQCISYFNQSISMYFNILYFYFNISLYISNFNIVSKVSTGSFRWVLISFVHARQSSNRVAAALVGLQQVSSRAQRTMDQSH